jgi:radical SAM protein with 4Fe4S-binding SPASM domain
LLRMSDNEYIEKIKLGKDTLRKSKQPLLKYLDMELTERCNNNCIHCNINRAINDRESGLRELTTESWKKIIRQAVEVGALTVRFTGGEPLLRKDFAELYMFARKSGLKVVIFTNGRLINEDLVELFSRVPPHEKIEITVFGMKKESYEAVTRVKDSFEEFQRGIELLRDKNIPFIVKGVMLSSNWHEIEDFENWASTLPWMNKPPSYSLFLDLRSRRDSETKNIMIRGLRLSPEEGLSIMARDKSTYINEMREFCQKYIGPAGVNLFNCGVGEKVCVDAYGMLQPCLPLRHPELLQDLNMISLNEARERLIANLKQVKAENPDYLERCARCFLKGLCNQCPARSWVEHGTPDTPVEYLCQVAHTQARFLGYLHPGEKAWEVEDWELRIKGSNTGIEYIEERRNGIRLSGKSLLELVQVVLRKNGGFRFRATGSSMAPAIQNSDVITISPFRNKKPLYGEVVAFCHPETHRLSLHRVIKKNQDLFLIKGDRNVNTDGDIPLKNIVGVVTRVERDHKMIFWPDRNKYPFFSGLYFKIYLIYSTFRKSAHLFFKFNFPVN